MAKRSSVSGARGINSTLRQITPGLTVPINEASRKALRPMLAQAKGNLRSNGNVLSGELLRLLTVKRDPDAAKTRPTHLVGPGTTSPGYRKAHLVEFGTAPHMVNGRMHPGSRAFPFLRPAFEATKDIAVTIFGREIGPAVERRVVKMAKKGKP